MSKLYLYTIVGRILYVCVCVFVFLCENRSCVVGIFMCFFIILLGPETLLGLNVMGKGGWGMVLYHVLCVVLLLPRQRNKSIFHLENVLRTFNPCYYKLN